jgi:hypothetical protein
MGTYLYDRICVDGLGDLFGEMMVDRKREKKAKL